MDMNILTTTMNEHIININDDDPDMNHSMLAAVHVHLSEVYSPPRAAAVEAEHGLRPGIAYYLKTRDYYGMPWDFDLPEQRPVGRAPYEHKRR